MVKAVENLLEKFIQFLNLQNEKLDNLAELGQDKKQFIILGKIKELDELIKTEAAAVNALQNLEEGRFSVQQEIASLWGKNVHEFAARELLEQVAQEYPAYRKDLEMAINRLDFNLTRLRAINSHNNDLLEHSLSYIEGLEAVINGDKAGIYSRTGQEKDETDAVRRKSLLDTRI